MNATDSSITFLKTQAIYIVPFFQRAYVWDEDNWNGLWETLASSGKNNFLGSIILKYLGLTKDDKMEYLIIDGQQRITTISILTQALIDGLDLKERRTDYYNHLHSYLFNMESLFSRGKKSDTENVKLVSSRNDVQDYQDVVNGKYKDNYNKLFNNKSKIVGCYCFFRTKINESNSETEIQNVITNVTEDSRKTLVKITLEGEDNEQAIFDTINRAGIRLTSSDIIKNNLFDKLSELLERNSKEVEAFFDKTWGKTFEDNQIITELWLTKKSVGKMERTNLELFLQAYAYMHPDLFDPTATGAKLENIAEAYKSYAKGFNLKEQKDFIADICSYANTYKLYFIDMKADIMEHGIAYYDKSLSADENQIKHLLQILSYIDTTTFDPYILKVIYENNDVCSKLKSLENYIVRDYIFKLGADKNFNNEAAQLIKDPAKYNPRYYFNLKNLNDDSLKNSLMNMKSNAVAKLLLYWVELKKSYESNSEKQSLYISKKSHELEHIMPQSPEKYWPIDYPRYDDNGNIFSDAEYEEMKQKLDDERNRLIFYIGNMTILSDKKNSELSNAPFDCKKNGFVNSKNKFVNGYKTSSKFVITSSIIDSSTWGKDEIIKRTKELFEDIVSIWPVD
jgi:uncharacterized protein with ParB-like and HNH nuclease domain